MLSLLMKQLLSFIPQKLPVGLTELNAYMDDVIELAGQYADKDSMRFAICSMLIHAPHDKGALSKRYFVVRLRKSAANQVASQVFQEIKQLQQLAEATAAKNTAADVKT